jgi:hypothetical protein
VFLSLSLCLGAWGPVELSLLPVKSFPRQECFLFCPISVLKSLGSGSEKPVSDRRLTATSPSGLLGARVPGLLTDRFGTISSLSLLLLLLLLLQPLPWIL